MSDSIGLQIDALFDLREKKRALERQVDEVAGVIESKEQALMELLDAQSMIKATGTKASVGITESIVPQVQDWPAYWAYIRRHNAFELLEKRTPAAAWREHAEKRRDHTLPGTVPYTKRKLSLRTV